MASQALVKSALRISLFYSIEKKSYFSCVLRVFDCINGIILTVACIRSRLCRRLSGSFNGDTRTRIIIIIEKNYFKSILAAVEAAANAYHVLRICWPIDVAAITQTHASPFVAERTLLFVSGVRVGALVSLSLSRSLSISRDAKN